MTFFGDAMADAALWVQTADDVFLTVAALSLAMILFIQVTKIVKRIKR